MSHSARRKQDRADWRKVKRIYRPEWTTFLRAANAFREALKEKGK